MKAGGWGCLRTEAAYMSHRVEDGRPESYLDPQMTVCGTEVTMYVKP